MVDLAKSDTEQIIHEVAWRLRRPVYRSAYMRDLAYAHEMGLPVHEWTGEDRHGRPMRVTWVTTDSGRLLSAYEIQGRA